MNDGWNVKMDNIVKSIYNTAVDRHSDCEVRMAYETVVNNRYIHQVDAFIFIFRYWYYKRNLYEARKAIRDALSVIVVTSEVYI